ncbi:MAG TPA: GNAT family N-acetyltransferase [Caulobacteraceae bacterium]|nr:GNAT family N-acetyltransferase [Caulobacteraceae bacterium]
MIETARVILRGWREADRVPYAAMMADPEVGDWLGGVLTEAQADAQVDRFIAGPAARGPGWLAIERRDDGAFLGAGCLREVFLEHPLAGEVEIGWRLARSGWGAGYATEAARALLDHGFTQLRLPEIIAFTAVANARSRAVMERLGLERRPARDFDHPALDVGHPLRRHVVYATTADAYRSGAAGR